MHYICLQMWMQYGDGTVLWDLSWDLYKPKGELKISVKLWVTEELKTDLIPGFKYNPSTPFLHQDVVFKGIELKSFYSVKSQVHYINIISLTVKLLYIIKCQRDHYDFYFAMNK